MSDYVKSFAVSDDYDYNETHKRRRIQVWGVPGGASGLRKG